LHREVTLAQKIKRLEKELENERLKNEMLNYMIDPSNSNTEQLSENALQYCSETYKKELRIHNITSSMTDGYDCYQNALAERVNGI
jgi:transposase InsO family protein